jgi:putative hydrolase of the HAD superfamily
MNFLFDLYGTLADIKTDEEMQSLWLGFAWLLGESDIKKVKDEYHAICKKHADAREHKFVEFDLLLVFEEMLENRMTDKSKAHELAREFRLLSRQKLRLFPHIVDILKGLKERGAGVYLVSNAQACFTRDEIEELGLTKLFDGILISSEAGVKKPHGAIFDIAFSKFSLDCNDCIYVGNDMHDDVLGASGAGLKTVYIETEQSGKYQNIDIIPTWVVSTHKDMMNLLFELSK